MKKGTGKSIGMRSLAFVVASLGLFGTAQSNFFPSNGSASVRTRDAINKMPQAPKPMRKTIQGGQENPYKYYKFVKKSQKKYRQHLRSNPHLYGSKKNRLNN